jgi:hypothetical protein
MLDADGSTEPAEIPQFVNAVLDGSDLANESRFVEGGHSTDITRLGACGNRLLSTSLNPLSGTHYTDLCYC